MKQVLEPAGSAALGAVLAGRIPIRAGERVCVVALGRERRARAASTSSWRSAAPLPGDDADERAPPAPSRHRAPSRRRSAEPPPMPGPTSTAGLAGPATSEGRAVGEPAIDRRRDRRTRADRRVRTALRRRRPSRPAPCGRGRAVLSGSLDLVTQARIPLRNASLYIGLLGVLTMGLSVADPPRAGRRPVQRTADGDHAAGRCSPGRSRSSRSSRSGSSRRSSASRSWAARGPAGR